MILVLALTLVSLLVLFVAYSALVGAEMTRGNRLILSGMRAHLDRCVSWLIMRTAAVIRYLDRHIIRLSWYYSLHSFLHIVLRIVVSVYDYFESWFHQNRQRARALRAERRALVRTKQSPVKVDTHLTSIAEHKEQNALSEKQRQKLKTKKLERG